MLGRKGVIVPVLIALAVAGGNGRLAAQEAPQNPPAQDTPSPAEAAAQLAGAYQLANADGDRNCALTLGARPLARGGAEFAVEFDKTACAAQILFSADIATWAPGPGNAIRLNAADGRLIAEFTEGVGGTWEALREADGVYFLTNPKLAEPAAQPADIFGAWELARPNGSARCRVDFGDTPVSDEAFRLAPDPGCAPLLGRTPPERWRLDRGDLVLEKPSDDPLRFAPNEEGGWAKVPDDALTLKRPPAP